MIIIIVIIIRPYGDNSDSTSYDTYCVEPCGCGLSKFKKPKRNLGIPVTLIYRLDNVFFHVSNVFPATVVWATVVGFLDLILI